MVDQSIEGTHTNPSFTQGYYAVKLHEKISTSKDKNFDDERLKRSWSDIRRMSDSNKLRTDHYATASALLFLQSGSAASAPDNATIDETIAAIKQAQQEAQDADDDAMRAFEEAQHEAPADGEAAADEGNEKKEEPEEPERNIPEHLEK